MRLAPRVALLIVILSTCVISAQVSQPNSITSLYDSIGRQEKPLIMDWGFAAFVQYNGKRILFDAGNDPDNLRHNAQTMGVDLSKIDFVVISHRHNDHASGFDYIAKIDPKVKAYLPDDPTFWTAPVKLKDAMRAELPAGVPKEELDYQGHDHGHDFKATGPFRAMDAVLVEKDTEIMPGVWIIHTRSKLVGDASGYPPNSPEKPGFEGIPELSLALKTPRGIVIITGCSHSGVEEIVAATKKTAAQNIDLVYGGFHMAAYDQKTIEAVAHKLKDELGVKRVAPKHCTGSLGLRIFREVFGKDNVYAGLGTVTEI